MLLRTLHASYSCFPLAICLLTVGIVWGQQIDVPAESVAVLIEGEVERAFSSTDRFDDTQLVQVVLKSVALENVRADFKGVRIPAPGEVVYVVVGGEGTERGSTQIGGRTVPQAGASIRAILRADGRGVWTTDEPNGIEVISAQRPSATNGRDRTPTTLGRSPRVNVRGMMCETTLVGGRLGLEVKQVDSEGPARLAGFQVGDVVIAIDGQPLVSADSVQGFADRPTPLNLTVIDVNTGRTAEVTLATSTTSPSGLPSPQNTRPGLGPDSTVRISNSLGIEVESVRIGLRRAVKVVTVDRAAPGAEAGLEPGDVIVAVGGQRISDIDEFAAALPNQEGPVTLNVRDVRSGREVPVEVVAATVIRPAVTDVQPPPSRRPSDARQTGPLGVATELAFYNGEAAVKVVEVERGGAASRAGIQPGWLILSANGTPVLHPDELAKLEQDSAGQLRLRVVNPASNRESSIDIEL